MYSGDLHVKKGAYSSRLNVYKSGNNKDKLRVSDRSRLYGTPQYRPEAVITEGRSIRKRATCTLSCLKQLKCNLHLHFT